MKLKNTSEGTLKFVLAEGETYEYGKVYAIVDGKAVQYEVDSGMDDALVMGVAMGGDHLIGTYIYLDIDPTSIFREQYDTDGDTPVIGEIFDGVKVVVDVDTVGHMYDYMLKKNI